MIKEIILEKIATYTNLVKIEPLGINFFMVAMVLEKQHYLIYLVIILRMIIVRLLERTILIHPYLFIIKNLLRKILEKI